VLIRYEEETFIGKVLSKECGQVKVQCLAMPFGTGSTPQKFERESDACHYPTVYTTNVVPTMQGSSTGRSFSFTY
jgi:hypothetical protein